MERAKPLSGKGVVENRCGAKLDVQRAEAAVCFRGHTPPASRLEYAIAAVRDHRSSPPPPPRGIYIARILAYTKRTRTTTRFPRTTHYDSLLLYEPLDEQHRDETRAN